MTNPQNQDSNLILNIGKVVMKYYDQATFQPSKHDFTLWIDSLREPMKSNFQKMGFESCKGILNFKRFVLELNDYGLEEFMKANLNPDEFNWWSDNK